ncbi:MAG: PilN domain-containing protein [Xanthomonadaceae bacterium]|jgi:type IV pilus assembly protein PilN|nr:PilN domain-containing protein [Xanthomonadaceae bacterium]
MARINLLPWREERRKQQQRDFYGALGLAVITGIVLAFLAITYYSMQISGQNARNDFLQAENKKLDEQIKEIAELEDKRNNLLARQKVIEELQANRSQMVHLFDALVRTIPDGVMLTSLKQDGSILTLEGRAQSSTRVSYYMRNLEGSGWMIKPDLSVIEAKEGDSKTINTNHVLPYMFTVRVTLADPNANTDGTQDLVTVDAAGSADTGATQQVRQNSDTTGISINHSGGTSSDAGQVPAAAKPAVEPPPPGPDAADGVQTTTPQEGAGS